jgi:NAD+ kinase
VSTRAGLGEPSVPVGPDEPLLVVAQPAPPLVPVVPASPRFAVLASPAAAAQQALAELSTRYRWVPVAEADVLVTVGGDGTLLHALHQLVDADRDVPVFGLHRGTTGFLLNGWRGPDDLEARVHSSLPERVVPLRLSSCGPDGRPQSPSLAFNEVALRRTSAQSARLRLLVDDVERLPLLVGDGLVVATPAGSTAYNRSAGGPVVPLSSGVLPVTPICALRPQRWPGALVSRTSRVQVEVLDHAHRPVAVSADGRIEELTSRVEVEEAPDRAATVLFDAVDTLTERVLRSQFGT